MTIGVHPPLHPITWRVDETSVWITHDEMICDVCGSKSEEGNRSFDLLYDGKWSKLYCSRNCSDEMDNEFNKRMGTSVYGRWITYYGDLVKYEIDENGMVEHIDTKGRVCECSHSVPSENNPDICKKCYGDMR